MSDAVLRTYVKDLETAYRNGNATEHTYRSYLKGLLAVCRREQKYGAEH